MDQLRGLLVKPNKLPEEITFDNSLEKKQELVEGYIEYAYSDDFPDVMILLQVILLLFQVMLKMEKMFLYLINKLKNTKKSSMISLLKIQT